MATSDRLSRLTNSVEEANIQRLSLYVIIFFFLIMYVLPLTVAVLTSVKTRVAVTQTLPFLPPGIEGFTLENWTRAFELLQRGLVNSLIMVIPVSIISAGMGSLAAYGLTQIDWRGQIPILLLIIASVFLPTQAAVVPLSKLWSIYLPLGELLSPLWGLPLLHEYHGDLIALIITNIAFGLPICTILFRSYYQGLSSQMIEAATVDGASFIAVYRRIVLPLSGPMFAVTIIYQFVQNWNSFLFPLIIMVSSNNPAAPVTLSLAGIGASLEGTNYGLRMAGALLTTLPTLIVFFIFGERFAKGVAGRS